MCRNAKRSTGVKVQIYKCHCRGTTYGLRIHTQYLYHALKQAIEIRNTVANAPYRVLKSNESLSGQVAYLEKHRLGEKKNPNFQCLQAYRAS
jgi:hypothetical protein